RATNVADEDLQFYMEGVGMPAPADEKQVDETSLQDVEDKIEELDYASDVSPKTSTKYPLTFSKVSDYARKTNPSTLTAALKA
ncbi:MAG: hypothetical protein ACHQAX_09500, partial [Gammaproteobacteria bacterium]